MPVPLLGGLLASPFLATVVGVVISAVVARILFALGVTFVIYTGLDTGLNALETLVGAQLTDFGNVLPGGFALMKMMGMVDFINMIFAAMTTVVVIKFTLGAFKKLTFS